MKFEPPEKDKFNNLDTIRQCNKQFDLFNNYFG